MIRLRWHSPPLAVCRLDSGAPIPHWALAAERTGPIWAVVRSAEELSIVTRADAVPTDVRAERDFVACEVVGPLDFELVGVLRRLLGPLADAGIPVLTLSTHDTDWILVRKRDAVRASDALGMVALLENAPPSV